MIESKLGKKIAAFMMIITLSICAAIFAVAYFDFAKLRKNSASMNNEMSISTTKVVSDGIISQTKSTMMEIASTRANNHNNDFSGIESQMEQLQLLMHYAYTNSQMTTGRAAPHFNSTRDGELMGRCAVKKGVPISSEIFKEEAMIYSAQQYISSAYDKNKDMMSNIMVGTSTGIFYRYSDYNTYDEDYDVTHRPWFTAALENPGEIIWSDAYLDVYGNNVVTVSCAFTDARGNYSGVIASDIKVQSLINAILMKDKINGGYAFLLDKNGKVLAHPSADSSQDFASLFDDNSAIKVIQKQMVSGGIGKATFNDNGEDMLIFYAPIEVTGWSYGIVVPYSSVTEPASEMSSVISEGTAQIQDQMNGSIHTMMAIFIFIFAITVILLIIASYQLAEHISRPIKEMVNEMEEIGKGNFESQLAIRGNDELTMLGDSINKMSDELKNYVEEITNVTAERQRIGAELDLATRIQASSLPNIFPAFPDRSEFDLYASMHPAKEVGGDFYDFFLIDEDHLGLVIADVSGKGVGAALFMMISKTLINNQSMFTESPAEILSIVNERLCKGNEAEMFVTVWLGILEISSGKLRAANAGHEYPAIKRAQGSFELFKDKHGFVLGGMEGLSFKEYEIQLEKGDSLFVYTDGVAEATNAENELFGTERMIAALNREADADSNRRLENVTEDISAFVKDAPQFDDITMLTITYKGKDL